METKKCKLCQVEKSIGEFYKHKHSADGYSYTCRQCQKKLARQWAILNPEKIKKTNKEMYEKNRVERIAKQKEWSLNNPDKIKKFMESYKIKHPELSRETSLKKHGLSLDDFNKMIIAQNNKCGICNKEFFKKSDAKVDHCHKTGDVRGLLCNHCNTALGFSLDDISILKSMIKYLEKHGKDTNI